MSSADNISHMIITGTTRGLGFSLCQLYLSRGCRVTGFARSDAPAAFGPFIASGRYIHVITDLSDMANANLIISEFLHQHTTTIIINAADYSESKSPEIIAKQLNLNLIVPIALIQKIHALDLDYIPKVVFISSIMAYIYDAKTPAYGAAKAAVSHFIDSLDIQGPDKIKFLEVIAGPMHEQIGNVSLLKKITSITYPTAADRIMRSINDGKRVIYIPEIWRYILYFTAILGRRRISVLLNKFR